MSPSASGSSSSSASMSACGKPTRLKFSEHDGSEGLAARSQQARERALRRRREWKRMARRREAEEMNMLEEQYTWYRQRILEARGISSRDSRAVNALPETLALAELAKRYQRRTFSGQRLQGLSPSEIRQRRNAQKRESKQRIQRYREERAMLLRQFIRSFKVELGEEASLQLPADIDWSSRDGPSQDADKRTIADTNETACAKEYANDVGSVSMTALKSGADWNTSSKPCSDGLEKLFGYSSNPLESKSGDCFFGARAKDEAANMAIAELDFVADLVGNSPRAKATNLPFFETDNVVSELLADMNASSPRMSAWDVSLLTTSGMNTIMSETPAMGRLLVGVRVFQGLFTSERAASVLGISLDIAQVSLQDLHNNGLLLAIPRSSLLGSQCAYLVPEHVRRIPPEMILELAGDGTRNTQRATPQIQIPPYDRESALWETQRILQRVEHNFVQDLRERLGRLETEARADQPDIWHRVRAYFDELQDDFFYAIALARRHYGIVGVSDLVASFYYCIRYTLKAEARAGIFKSVYERFEPALQRYLEFCRGHDQPLASLDSIEEQSRGSLMTQQSTAAARSIGCVRRMYPHCLDVEDEAAGDPFLSNHMTETRAESTTAAMLPPEGSEISLTFADEIEHAILAGLSLSRAYIDSLSFLEAERILRQLLQVCLRHAPMMRDRGTSSKDGISGSDSLTPLGPRSFFANQHVHLLLQPFIHIAILENLGRLHAQQGRTKSACRCLAQTLMLRRRLGQERSIPYALTLISFGDSLIHEHRLETARNAFEEALVIFDIQVRHYDDRFELSSRAEALYYLALLHFVAGRNEQALDLLNQGLEILDRRHSSSLICCSPRTVLTLEAMIFKLLAQIYIATNRREHALVLLQNALDLVSSTYGKGIETGIHGGSQNQDEHATRELVDALRQLVVDTDHEAGEFAGQSESTRGSCG
ncbi:hypothetical protein F1559_002852 [Cyanidiococcus yangmingshanensis]|uniref:Uncharacterized protein n=1 Tax=Cyanidiococcus yangmingshanensis TaxID=2690220 RepID=A0A7J7IJK7_9RHOD|nr:hypothetical protein F1559_002852 [Cyanidiococcus yangmingshanensis]